MNRSERCLHTLFEEQTLRTPDAVALIANSTRLTYGQLNERANQIARRLMDLGAGPETLVGLFLHRTHFLLPAMLGILKSGAAYCPVDPAYPPARIAFMLEDAGIDTVVTQEEIRHLLPPGLTHRIIIDSEWEALAQRPKTNFNNGTKSDNVCVIIYTSGSTGRPKAVAIEHRSVVSFIDWITSLLKPAVFRGVLAGSSVCFDLSMCEHFSPLAVGGTVIEAENTVALATLESRNEVTLINSVPAAIATLVEIGAIPDNVSVVISAGEVPHNKIIHDVYATTQVKQFYNMYGPCEDTIYSSYVLASRDTPTTGLHRNSGVPIPGTQFYIMDEQSNRLPDGQIGEIGITGDGLARGYLKRPELTAERFVQNPFGPGRLYLTGDLGRILPDGNLEFHGRADYQVKIRGFRVEPGEIEAVLGEHQTVDRAVVVAVPDTGARLQLVAWVKPKANAAELLSGSKETQAYLDLWRQVYEDAYASRPVSADPSLNTTGWSSSYTGLPIPEAQMRDWLAHTMNRILPHQPKQVLELGCGTGMIAARLAPHVEHYIGLDISTTAIEHIRSMQGIVPGLERVTLYMRSADQLDDFETGSFDMVIVNSVAQHFPDSEYLAKIIESAARLVKPGGQIFMGDLISYALKEAFFASIQGFRAQDADKCGQILDRIRHQESQARDLMIAPLFFEVLAGRIPAIKFVEAAPKLANFENEMTVFRYDATLYVGQAPSTRKPTEWLDWSESGMSLDRVRELLAAKPEMLAIRNIPNARLDREIGLVVCLADAAPWETAVSLRERAFAQSGHGVRIDDLAALESLGYRVDLSWLNTDNYGRFDAVLTRADLPAALPDFTPQGGWRLRDLQTYATRKQIANLEAQLVPSLRHYLADRLPHYMVPAIFKLIDEFPLSPNLKVNRLALAQRPIELHSTSEPAETSDPIERLLLELWAELFNVSHVGLYDNFFEMGGDSLRAITLMYRLQQKLDCAVRPAVLMQRPTVAGLVAWFKQYYPGIAVPQEVATVEGEI